MELHLVNSGDAQQGSNPELFFAFNKDGRKFRQYITKFFGKTQKHWQI